ncbi:hypothetical protein [Ornithinimicrobium tianjinense]|uniref:DUF559 domain-containing protein n=1 Tax=Ornithinimicrobium tianjinense TaxID=1195761 RepID=A0A917F4F3_9MICO|nr:hypothetical protein [Ornithinimicrobium tianjinense]GGF47565.1 hypothetical protein GCM10011366_14180 [Ornithinimicrobium tianjinense]
MGTINLDEPFRVRDAVAAGHSRRLLRSAAFVKILPGVCIRATAAQDARTAAQAVLLVAGEEAFVSHHQAARLWGAVVPETDTLHASVPGNRHRSRRPEVCVHRSSRSPVRLRGIPLTSAVDTFVDLAGHLSFIDLVVLGDSLVKRGRTTPAQLVAAAAEAPRSVRRRAVRAAAFVRTGVDSPMETRSRMLVVLAGLPEPAVDIRFFDDDGELVRRLDMGYRKHRLALEYDGRQHAESQEQWESDVARREEFDDADWRIVTLLAKDVYRTPAATLERVVRAMRKQGLDVSITSDEWRRHFPGHTSLS